MAQFYIDNSVFGRICKSREFAEGFDKAVLQNPKLPKSYTPLFTPFSLMEFIGLTVKIDPIPADDSLSDKIKNAKDSAYKQNSYLYEYLKQLKQKVLEQLDADERFTIEYIKDLQDEKLSYINDADIREKIKPFIQYGKIDNNELNKITAFIAADQAYNHNFREDIKKYVYSLIRIDMVDFILNNINQKSVLSYSFSRVMSKLWDYLMKLNKDNDLIKNNREYFDKMTESMRYKGHRDMMDAELIHLAMVGQPHGKNEKEPTYCYTCDDYEQTRRRVLGYKHIIEDVFKDFRRYKPSNLEINLDINNNLIMGTIAFCDQHTGEISKILDVKQMPGIREDIELQSSKYKKSTLKVKNNSYKLDEKPIQII